MGGCGRDGLIRFVQIAFDVAVLVFDS